MFNMVLVMGEPEIKYSCAWCNKGLVNQSEQKYKLRGNICEACNVKMSHKAWNREHNKEGLFDIRQLSKKIKERQELLELIGEGLSLEITEEDRQIIETKMKLVYHEIKDLRKLL